MNKHAIFIFFVLLAIPAGLMDIHLIGIHFTLISLPPLLAASFLGPYRGVLVAIVGGMSLLAVNGPVFSSFNHIAFLLGAVWLFGVIFSKWRAEGAAVVFLCVYGLLCPLIMQSIKSSPSFATFCLSAILNLTIAHFVYGFFKEKS
ncbi:hypothetical protein [Rossellomorea marisflavi]|jgi:hypothetical protein|uniref:hypothetical protein n=1 Tax=Rossellomorea marisflavi TaxID=189381 RepID=UPI0006F6A96E|nr:hypothetical protein [Rossellomorea marisflavi]KQU59982.1 hypothetical protein ASG66_09865 [Bacillus sp. Leaf406]